MGLISRVSSRTYRNLNMSSAGDVRIVLDDLTPHNVKQFKKINHAVFPVHYNDKFYSDAQKSDIHFAKLAYFNDLVVGAVCFRLEDSSSPEIGLQQKPVSPDDVKKSKLKRVYIMTLGCLAPYRRYGVGSKMVEWVISESQKMGDIDGIFLHVQINNLAAKQFYEKQSFNQQGDVCENYYKRVEPAHAFLLHFPIEPKEQSAGDSESVSAMVEDAQVVPEVLSEKKVVTEEAAAAQRAPTPDNKS